MKKIKNRRSCFLCIKMMDCGSVEEKLQIEKVSKSMIHLK